MHAVVDLVLLLQAAQDGDGVLDARLAHVDGLEAALKGGVLLDVLVVLVKRGGADGVQLAAGQRRLEHVAGIDRTLGGAGAHDGVELVDKEHDLAVRLLNLVEHGLEALLKLAAVLGASQHAGHVEGDDVAVLERGGHVAGDDALGQALHDGGLAGARLANEHRVVLGAAGEHLDGAANLLGAADDRVELAGAGLVGEVAAVLLEGLKLLLGVAFGDARIAAQVLVGLLQAL